MSIDGIRAIDRPALPAVDHLYGGLEGLSGPIRVFMDNLALQLSGTSPLKESFADLLLKSTSTLALATSGSSTANAANATAILALNTANAGVKPDKESVRVLITTNTAYASITNGSTHDGVVLATGDRVGRAYNGATGDALNGVVVVQSSGAAVRSTDMDTSDEILRSRFNVNAGTRAGEAWTVQNTSAITVGTTPIVIAKTTPSNPFNAEITTARRALATLGDSIYRGVSLHFTTKAAADADLNHPAGTLAMIVDELKPGFRTLFVKVGSPGLGGWDFWEPGGQDSGDYIGNLAYGNGHRFLRHDPGVVNGAQFNTHFGRDAGRNITNQWGNTGVGYHACDFFDEQLHPETAGPCFGNTAVGYYSMGVLRAAFDNTAVGTLAMLNLNDGDDNCAFGIKSMMSLVVGSDNAAYGYGALEHITSGERMLAIGSQAGRHYNGGASQLTSGVRSMFIGDQAYGLANDPLNEMVIGTNGRGRGNHTYVLGNSEHTEGTLMGRVTRFPGHPGTVAALPTAASAGKGARSFVTDANANTFNTVAAGGGANNVPVFSDGTAWRIG